MANNRIEIKCNVCGKRLGIAKSMCKGFYTPPGLTIEKINEFFEAHAFCHWSGCDGDFSMEYEESITRTHEPLLDDDDMPQKERGEAGEHQESRMIRVTVGSNYARKFVVVSEQASLISVLRSAGVDTSYGYTSVNGVKVPVTDLHKTFSDLCITDDCLLMQIYKACGDSGSRSEIQPA